MKKSLFKDGSLSYEEVMSRVKAIDPIHDLLYKKQDDISMARLFADVFKDVARYNINAKSWYTYDGIRWKKDIGGMKIETNAKTIARVLAHYAADQEDHSYSQYVSKIQERRKRTSMIEDSRDFYYVESASFDADPYLFNCQNCIIDLRTHEALEHDPKYLISKVSNVTYDPSATSPDFEKFLNEIMCGDIEKAEYLQRIGGYALVGENTQEECYMCYGATTRNGKSTFLDTLEHLFGDYAASIAPESLAQKDRNSRNASSDIARLDGVRFLHCGEPQKKMKFDVALLKSLLGRDVITARNLYELEFQFTPIFTLFFNSNYLPVVTDDTLFSSGRIKVIPFDRHFEDREQDRQLKNRLKRKDNISGIFNWLLQGLSKYQDDGEIIAPPEVVVRATADYREKSDKIKSFMKDCLRPSGEAVTAKVLYDVFSSWCHENGYGVENKGNFLDELRNKGLLSPSGTVNGRTEHNVLKGYSIDESYRYRSAVASLFDSS